MKGFQAFATHNSLTPKPHSLLFLTVLLGLASVYLWLSQLQTPMLWWDEGWTLIVARTWVEQGVYGRLQLGQPFSPGLAASFPSVASIAISFQLFGVGIWQGRLPGAIYTIAGLSMLFALAMRLYNSKVAWGTLFVLLTMLTHQAVNPLVLGRQVLAEPLQIFSLLAGYLCFLLALERSLRWLPLALVLWGLALITKAQTLPFWAISLLIPLGFALNKRQWRMASVLVLALPGGYAASHLLLLIAIYLQGPTLPSPVLEDLTEAIAFAPGATTRGLAIMALVVTGIPLLCGLIHSSWHWLASYRSSNANEGITILRTALLALAGSWFCWYLFLSVGWIRYLMPALFVGSIFVAAWLADVTENYNLHATIQRILAGLKLTQAAGGCWKKAGSAGASFLALVLIITMVPITMQQITNSYTATSVAPLQQLATYLNYQTPPDTIVESYESELFFLLERPYHFPPDQMNVEMIQRNELQKQIPFTYDALVADPDYLVVGDFARNAGIYDEVIAAGHFWLVQRYDSYDLFQRVRN